MAKAAGGVLGLSPGFKFDPADDELVEHYLVARLLHRPVPFDGVIIEDDPRSAPPSTLLRKHGLEEEGFFFAEGEPVNGKAGSSRHKKRTCAGGGGWQGQRLCGGARRGGEKVFVGGVEIRWTKYMLSFYAPGEDKSSGWVMHEYAVTSPPDLASSSSTRLYRIRRTEHGAKKRKIRESESDSSEGDGGAAAARMRVTGTETEVEHVDDLLLQEHHHHHPWTSAPASHSASRDPRYTVDCADVVDLPASSEFQFQPTAAEVEAYYSSAGPSPAPATFSSSDQETPAGMADDQLALGTASDHGGAASAAWTTTTTNDGLFFLPPSTADDTGLFFDLDIPEDMDFNSFFTFPDDPCGGLPAADGSGCHWS